MARSSSPWHLVCPLLVASMIHGQPAPAVPEKPGRVEGSVTNAVTQEPMPNVRVMLLSQQTGPTSRGKRYGAITNAEGNFAWATIDPGTYQLDVSKQGFILMRSPSTAENLVIKPSSTLLGLALSLAPEAVIGGRVVDDHGDPVERASVEVFSETSGMRRAATTNDRGEFRVGSLPPGKYRVRATPRAWPIPPEVRTDGTKEEAYGPTWYPRSLAAKGASSVEARGAETTVIEIHLARVAVVCVSGVVSGVPPGSENVWVMFHPSSDTQSHQAMVKNGKFSIWRLPPDKYSVSVQFRAPDGRMLAATPTAIEVGNDNIENLAFDMVPEFDLIGQIQWASPPPSGSLQETETIRLETVEFRMPGPPMIATIGADRTFRIPKVVVGRYQLVIRGMPDGLYVKSVQLNSREMPGRILDLRAPGALTVVLSLAGAQISGVVEDNKGPVADVVVYLMEDVPESPSLRTLRSGADGTYSFTGIAPGTYRISVGRNQILDNVSVSGPAPSDAKGVEVVQVVENEKKTRNIKIDGPVAFDRQ